MTNCVCPEDLLGRRGRFPWGRHQTTEAPPPGITPGAFLSEKGSECLAPGEGSECLGASPAELPPPLPTPQPSPRKPAPSSSADGPRPQPPPPSLLTAPPPSALTAAPSPQLLPPPLTWGGPRSGCCGWPFHARRPPSSGSGRTCWRRKAAPARGPYGLIAPRGGRAAGGDGRGTSAAAPALMAHAQPGHAGKRRPSPAPADCESQGAPRGAGPNPHTGGAGRGAGRGAARLQQHKNKRKPNQKKTPTKRVSVAPKCVVTWRKIWPLTFLVWHPQPKRSYSVGSAPLLQDAASEIELLTFPLLRFFQ